jgi:hypothetical protein
MYDLTCKDFIRNGLLVIYKKKSTLHGCNRAIERGRHTRRLLAILPYFNCTRWSITTMPTIFLGK